MANYKKPTLSFRAETGDDFTVSRGTRARFRAAERLTWSRHLHTEDKDVMPEELLRLVNELGLFLHLLSW